MGEKKEQTKYPIQERLSDKEYDRLKRIQKELMGSEKNYTKHHKRK